MTDTRPRSTLAVYGGSFDPVHNGHLAIARAARDTGAADLIMFMPARLQPLKQAQRLAPGNVRAAMIEAAIAGEPQLTVSTLELERPGPSYTIDTLRQVAALHPAHEVAFLCGADALAGMAWWHEPVALLTEFTVLVAERPGEQTVAEAKRTLAAHGLPATALARVHTVPAPLLDISATAVRARVGHGDAIDSLVPPAVADIITRERLYMPAS